MPTVDFHEIARMAGARSSSAWLLDSVEKTPSKHVLNSTSTVTILVVEDEKLVGDVIAEMLQGDGFSVLKAEHGREALDICQAMIRPIDLILTDVVMPHMGGLQLADLAKQIMPDTAILFMSGQVENPFLENMILSESDCFIEKPFSVAALLGKVRETLKARRGSADRKAFEKA